MAMVAALVVAAAGGGAVEAQGASLGDRPLAGLRAWGESTGRVLSAKKVTSTQVAGRLRALRREVTAAAPRLRSASAVVKTRELARSRVALGATLDPLAKTLSGSTRDLFFVTYQHELERLAISARLDRTPTGRPLELSGESVVPSLGTKVRPDTDGDGTSDVEEIDDDGDGIVDRSDTSDQGWGIPDALQVREDLDDDVDEDGTPDTPADSLQTLRAAVVPPRAEGLEGAYCLQVTEAVPALSSIAATRNLLDVATSRGCQATPKVDAPAARRVPKGGPAKLRDATANNRTMLIDVSVKRTAKLKVTVSQRVVIKRDGTVRYDERRAVRSGIVVGKGRRTISVPLSTAFSPGAAAADVTVTAGKRRLTRLTVPVTVIGSAQQVGAASLPGTPITTTARVPGAPVRLLSAAPDGANRVILTFDAPVGPSADDPASYRSDPNLFVTGAARLPGLTKVALSTGRQYAVPYTVTAAGVSDPGGVPLAADARSATFTGSVPVAGDRPRVTAAGSTGNRSVLVQFSKPLADSALSTSLYQVVRESSTQESGGVKVLSARFTDESRLAVELETGSQNEVTYRARVTGIVDLTGQPLADKGAAATAADPTSATFVGTPPANDRADTDCDGVSDNEEAAGWTVVVVRAGGQETRTDVTSDPGRPGLDCANPTAEDDRNADGVIDSADTDGDNLTDDVERSLGTNPRDGDSDDDGLADDVEYNESFSDPLQQDTDDDSLTDGLELTFFSTSPLLADTDGDQISDDTEITLGNRNPRIGDLPRPGLEIGGTDLRLDVRFTDVEGSESRVAETKSVGSQLVESEGQKFSTTDTRAIEASSKISATVGAKINVAAGAAEGGGRVSQEYSFSTTTEESFSSTFTTQWSEESSRETQQTWSKSQQSEVAQSKSANRTRSVEGARMSATVDLRADGDIAFTIRHLQLSAFMQDPQNPTRLTPVATMLPVAEPDSGFTLGPLVPRRGPIIFENTQVFPAQIEELMRNPRGLVFRFSNYDITDELGRNFAFTSQAVNDRTAGLVIDYGGYDADNDGVGDETESRRVATGTGRRVDTNENGVLDEGDRKMIFGPDGKNLGITLRDALAAIGLTEYREVDTPTNTLTQEQIDNSYSIFTTANGAEKLYRVRRTSLTPGVAQTWEIVGPTGIDGDATLDSLILRAGQTFTLAFLQDVDQDRVPAIIESLNRCMDTSKDSDGDGLDDRFEIYVGWRVNVIPRGSRQVRSSCAAKDSDADGRFDDDEAPSTIERDADGLIVFTTGHEPRRDITGPRDPQLDWDILDPVTDPTSPDTDGDGLSDDFELDGFSVELISPPALPDTFTPVQKTSPERFDSDGDTASDGVEQRIGGDPLDSDYEKFGDADGDGVVNVLEDTAYDVTVRDPYAGFGVCDHKCPSDGPPTVVSVKSNKELADSDGDGLLDGEERELKTNPNKKDTDGDKLTDFEEVRGFTLRDLGIVTTDPLLVDSDRDRRPDGVEAGRAGNPIIVRVAGEDPYISPSDPRDADQDLDRLVDGDEAKNGTDPLKANTDGDNQSDYDEVTAASRGQERRALVPDYYVELTLAGMDIKEDGDGEDSAGDYEFGITARGPDGGRLCNPGRSCDDDAPGADLLGFPVNSHRDGGAVDLPGCSNGTQLSTCQQSDRRVQARDDRGEIPFRKVLKIGSVSKIEDKYESFQVEGFVHEFEGDDLDCNVVFPNPLRADEENADSGIFPGTTLQPGVKTLTFRGKARCLNEGNNLDLELYAYYTAG